MKNETGDLLVEWERLDMRIRAHEHLAKQEKKKRDAVVRRLQELMEASDPPVESTHNGRFRVNLTTTKVVESVDWEALYKHIHDTGEFELLHRRLSVGAAVKAGLVPGVELMDMTQVKVTKVAK